MVIWIVRLEKVEQHILHVRFREGKPIVQAPLPEEPIRLQLTKHPSISTVSLFQLASAYHATSFIPCLQTFFRQLAPPANSPRRRTVMKAIETIASQTIIVPAYHRIRLVISPAQDIEGIADHTDAIHVRPATCDKKGRVTRPERFDTALVDEEGEAGNTTLNGQSITRLKRYVC